MEAAWASETLVLFACLLGNEVGCSVFRAEVTDGCSRWHEAQWKGMFLNSRCHRHELNYMTALFACLRCDQLISVKLKRSYGAEGTWLATFRVQWSISLEISRSNECSLKADLLFRCFRKMYLPIRFSWMICKCRTSRVIGYDFSIVVESSGIDFLPESPL
jgi:hypothetical protein